MRAEKAVGIAEAGAFFESQQIPNSLFHLHGHDPERVRPGRNICNIFVQKVKAERPLLLRLVKEILHGRKVVV